MRHFSLEIQNVGILERLKKCAHGKSAIGADGHLLKSPQLLDGVKKRRACVFLISQHIAADLHAYEAFLRQRMGRQRLDICFQSPNEALVLLDLLGEILYKPILQLELLAAVVGLHDLQL